MRQFSVGGSTGTRILGEALPNLDQGACTYELDDLIGLRVKDVDDVEVEVAYDDVIDVNDKSTFLLKSVKVMIKKYQILKSLSLRVKPMKEECVECIRVRLLLRVLLKILKMKAIFRELISKLSNLGSRIKRVQPIN